jgi:Relaxase/Mobilisation nuclease domain
VIAKKVKSGGGGSKGGKVSGLADYITDEKDQEKDKIDYFGGRGFLCDDLKSQKAEMIALASDAPRCTNPISHWIVSWQEGERPTREQVEESIDVMLAELGMPEHQVIYAAHNDTDNYHVHLMINRVHPDTLKVQDSYRDVEEGHKAVAKIEYLQGWQREDRGRYEVVDGAAKKVQHPSKTKELGQKQQHVEIHQGEKSAERIAIEQGADLIRAATSWQDLHESLADQGMRYERVGNGAYLYVGETKLKASSAGRDCSLPNMQKRLGDYEESQGYEVAEVEVQALEHLPPEQQDYIRQRAAHRQSLRETARSQKNQHIQQSKGLRDEQKTRREDLTAGNSWKGQGEVLNALRSAIALEQERERQELRERQVQERATLKVAPFPEFEEWLKKKQSRDEREVSQRVEPPSRGMSQGR